MDKLMIVNYLFKQMNDATVTQNMSASQGNLDKLKMYADAHLRASAASENELIRLCEDLPAKKWAGAILAAPAL